MGKWQPGSAQQYLRPEMNVILTRARQPSGDSELSVMPYPGAPLRERKSVNRFAKSSAFNL
jgi:hypothetical protein